MTTISAKCRSEVLELEKRVIEHLNNEMKLTDEIDKLNLTKEENDYLLKVHLEHPHAKRTEKRFNINMKEWVENLIEAGNK